MSIDMRNSGYFPAGNVWLPEGNREECQFCFNDSYTSLGKRRAAVLLPAQTWISTLDYSAKSTCGFFTWGVIVFSLDVQHSLPVLGTPPLTITRCWSIKTRSSTILRPQKSLQQAILLGFFEFCWNPIAWNCWLSPWCWIGPQSQTKSPWMVGIAWIEGVKGTEGIDNLYIQLRIMIPSLSLSFSLQVCIQYVYTHIYI
jgi:hypothetical protein